MRKTCSIEGCESQSSVRGWCPKHYTRWKVTGDPLKTKPVGARKKPKRPCVVEGCGENAKSLGLCGKHYQRLHYHGSVDTVLNNRNVDTVSRFMLKVEVTPTGCWKWLGVITPKGYGYFRDGKMISAHRWSFSTFVGPIPDDLQIDHLCHTDDSSCPGGNDCPHRRCVNPAHLEPVTPQGNSLRGLRRSREYR
jgi:hypothetical protein